MKRNLIAAAMAAAALAGCQTLPPPAPATASAETPDERRARAICEDMVTSDAAYGGGADTWIANCMQLRLREIRSGMR